MVPGQLNQNIPDRYAGLQPHECLSNKLIYRLMVKEKITMREHAKYKHLKILKYHPGYNFFEDPDSQVVALCRGLVWSQEEERIVANPMPKFFNHFNYSPEHLDALFQKYEYHVYEKVDGSCVYCWFYGGEWHFSTLGAFDSEQARVAKNIFARTCAYSNLNKDCTYAFEVVYPDNRIVLDYKNKRSLRLLACRNVRTFTETRNPYVHGKINTARRVDMGLDELLHAVETGENQEGYVVAFHVPHDDHPTYVDEILRIKFKTKWYFERSRTLEHVWRGSLIKHLGKRDQEGVRIDNADIVARGWPDIYFIIDSTMDCVEEAAAGINRLYGTRKDQATAINALDIHKSLKSALFGALDLKKRQLRRLAWKAYEDETQKTVEKAYLKYRNVLYTYINRINLLPGSQKGGLKSRVRV